MKTLYLQKRRRAFTLVEVTLAIGIAAFCLTVLVALMPTGMHANRDSRDGYRAIEVLREVLLDRQNSASTLPSVKYSIEAPYPAPIASDLTGSIFLDKNGEVISQSEATYRCDYRLAAPPVGSASAVWMHCRLSWPPAQAAFSARHLEAIVPLFMKGDMSP